MYGISVTMISLFPFGSVSMFDTARTRILPRWATRYPMVDGHGNFGSVDGDGAAAMRYTEARLSKISMEMLADINKDTVDFAPNFDETEKEPVVMPARYPNLLVNGTSGIAVGMATNIPPHNLREVVSAIVKIIDNIIEEDRTTDLEEILGIVKGPDFPTGAEILGTRGIDEAYRITGCPVLCHVDECSVDRAVAVRVIFTHRITDDTRALTVRLIRRIVQFTHGVQNTSLYRL